MFALSYGACPLACPADRIISNNRTYSRVIMNTLVSNLEHRMTPKAEAFCLLVAQGSGLTDAYRQTHNPATERRQTVYENASRLAAQPAVRARIAELQAQIAERVVVSAAALRMRQHAVAFAPALTHTKAYNCRHCNASPPKATQWVDYEEYADAVIEWHASLTQPKPLSKPLFGGVGYDHFAPPNPRCRACRGVGERFVYGPQDTTQLDPEMAASYRGAAVDPRTGVVKIEQADPDAALRELTAMTPGGYAPKQSESKAAVEHTHRIVPAELTVEEARAALARHRRAPVTIEQPPQPQDTAP